MTSRPGRMNHSLRGTVCAALVGASAALAALAAEEDRMTVITSDRLTFDYQQQFAHFEGRVVVTDAQLKLTADEMHVRFLEGGAVQSILAKGRVVIEQPDLYAQAETARYDVVSGEMVLEGEPRVRRGKDVLTADRIVYWRDEGRLLCEPRARLIISPQPGGSFDSLFGDR